MMKGQKTSAQNGQSINWYTYIHNVYIHIYHVLYNVNILYGKGSYLHTYTYIYILCMHNTYIV